LSGLSWSLSSERHWLTVWHWLLIHLHLHLLLVHHVWWHHVVDVHVISIVETHWNWWSLHVLVWVKSSKSARKGSQISERCDLDHLVLLVVWIELGRRDVGTTVVVILVVIVSSLVLIVALHLLWHWRKSDTFWEIWKWVNKLSSFFFIMEE
jgi:hypothetical protein